MTLEEQERLGIEARNVLGNAAYKRAYEEFESKLVSQMAQAEITKERAEYLRTLLVASRKVRQILENTMVSGKLAAEDMERERTFAQRMRDRANRWVA